ncbi:hypothetical protein [Secundilactobacillus folii]|uniref:Uncharacterized protein n=1 Tax=Secundilactobacillus folii TaxID=2678357 RepID=A0A7X2XZ22_9LACO|nr:hypothetical protein [Secundilactobacillus folii]MTV82941.1 hypothetical protein [Secundilactobacillus folii]
MKNYVVRNMSWQQQRSQPSISLSRSALSFAVSNLGQIKLTAGVVAKTEALIAGYQAMGQLNSEIVQEYLPCEAEVAELYLDA